MANRKRHKKNIIQEHRKVVIVATIITIIVLAIIMRTMSKYALKKENTQAVIATRFYFESNLLSTDGKINDFYGWDGKSEYDIEFEISNFEDILRYNTQDISYRIEIEEVPNIDIKCFITDGEKNEMTETQSGILYSGKQSSDKVTLKVNTNSEISDKLTLNVSIISESPYTETLSGEFNINVSSKDYNVNLIEETDYEKLIITTYGSAKKLKIKYDSTKLMLYTDNLTNSEDGIILTTEENSNYQIEFVRLTTDKIKLNTDDISIEELE